MRFHGNGRIAQQADESNSSQQWQRSPFAQLPRRQILQVDNHSIEFTWESCHPVTLNLATKMSTGIREESVRHMVELEGSVGGWANDELVDLL